MMAVGFRSEVFLIFVNANNVELQTDGLRCILICENAKIKKGSEVK